jgi:hypothetical protein
VVKKLILLAALVFAPFQAVTAHPLHMSFTEVRRVNRGGSVELSIRVFADDFSTAAARYSRARLDSSQIIDTRRAFAYSLAKIRLSHRNGSAVALVPCGMTRVGVMLHLCLRARLASSEPLKIANTMMTDLFADQVNVVQSVGGRSRTSRMFVKGDTWKPLS